MYKERSCQIDIYQLYLEFLRKKVIRQVKLLTNIPQQIIEHEVIVARSQHYAVK